MLGDILGDIFLFSILSIIAFIVIIVLDLYKKYVISSIVSICIIIFFIFKFTFIFEHISVMLFIPFCLIYLLIGIGWSTFRYYKFVFNQYKNVDLRYNVRYKKESTSPETQKYNIIAWIINWPMSIISFFITELYEYLNFSIADFFLNIYKSIQTKCIHNLIGEFENNKDSNDK